jgi:hypothetical protein
MALEFLRFDKKFCSSCVVDLVMIEIFEGSVTALETNTRDGSYLSKVV